MAQISRREFMAGAAAATAAFAAPNIIAGGLKQDRIKVGMVGCGGRGTGAAVNSTQADEGVVIWAMGDLFQDRLDGSRNYLSGQIKERLQVPKERQFVGFDAYKHVIAQDVDYVILATPPAFRPMMLEAAVDAGKNVFFEKPVATDAFGIRKVIGAANKAKDMGLSLVTGTQRRHDKAYMECMDRIHNGQIGDVVATYAYWNQGGLWMHPRQKEWSDLEWEIRNWLYFTWLSGDHIVEQHVHNLDVSNWSKNGHPVKCTSLGGRQVRTDPAYGQIFDHFATEYEYEDGTKLLSMCRQIDNCASRVSEYIVGTKGKSNANTSITGENPWRWDGERQDPYMLEHKDLIASIRGGKAVNEGVRVAHSTMTAIMGRMSCYTGQEVTWDMAMNSQLSLIPDTLNFQEQIEVPPVAMPGTTKFM